jgi:hypothetical protein
MSPQYFARVMPMLIALYFARRSIHFKSLQQRLLHSTRPVQVSRAYVPPFIVPIGPKLGFKE